MTNHKQPAQWEATLLASVMAGVGAPFFFDKLGSLVHACVLCVPAAIHLAPVLLLAVGAILILAEQDAPRAESDRQRQNEGGQQ
jgi:hypothetical protein